MVRRAPIRVVGSNVAQPTGLADAARPAAGIARGAMLIAGLTIVSRILGLVPTLVYELVLGGALTSAMVPVLARSAERAATDPAEKARVSQITSALLTWSVIILVPIAVVIVAV